jgi:protein OS-9
MHSSFIIIIIICLALSLRITARLHHSLIPEDPHAFPKYHIAFLNALPLLNDTAHHWLRDGLQAGELEFLDQPWQSDPVALSSLKRIDGAVTPTMVLYPQLLNLSQFFLYILKQPHDNLPTHRLQLMKMGPDHSYLCLIPPEPHIHDSSFPSEDSALDVNLLHSWSLLQPLSGKCLYVSSRLF